jgi:hypothetical protein
MKCEESKNGIEEKVKCGYRRLFINIVDAASCRILGKSGKMPLLHLTFMNYPGESNSARAIPPWRKLVYRFYPRYAFGRGLRRDASRESSR